MKSKEQRKADAAVRAQNLDDFKARAKAKELARKEAFQVKQSERKASAPPPSKPPPVLKPSAKLLDQVEQNKQQQASPVPPPRQRKPRSQFWAWFDSLDNNF